MYLLLVKNHNVRVLRLETVVLKHILVIFNHVLAVIQNGILNEMP